MLRLLGWAGRQAAFAQRQSPRPGTEIPRHRFHHPRQRWRRCRAYPDQEGHTADKTFNTLSGSDRQLYDDVPDNRQIDVFVGSFDMRHKLPIADRLAVEPLTLPLAELFLTKAQIVTLTAKTSSTCRRCSSTTRSAGDVETINAGIIADLCAKDWGLYTTVMLNVQKVAEILAQGGVQLDAEQQSLVLKRIADLKDALERSPKSLAWKMRARVGTPCPVVRGSRRSPALARQRAPTASSIEVQNLLASLADMEAPSGPASYAALCDDIPMKES